MPGLVGIRPGESRVVPFTFPDPFPQNEALAGLPAELHVAAKELFEWKLPMLTLDLVQSVLPQVGSLEEMRETLLEGVRMTVQTEMLVRGKGGKEGSRVQAKCVCTTLTSQALFFSSPLPTPSGAREQRPGDAPA